MVVALDGPASRPSHRFEQAIAVIIEASRYLAHDAVGVLGPPRLQVLGDRFPLLELAGDHPVNDLADPFFNDLR